MLRTSPPHPPPPKRRGGGRTPEQTVPPLLVGEGAGVRSVRNASDYEETECSVHIAYECTLYLPNVV